MYTRVQFMLTEDLYRRLRQAARARGVSMSQFVREALERALAEDVEARRQRRRKVLAELEQARQALEQAGFQPLSGEDIVEMLNEMREERMDEILGNAFGVRD